MKEEEYIDYSCSTPLERAARDVESILRSWHICDGSDRHVSSGAADLVLLKSCTVSISNFIIPKQTLKKYSWNLELRLWDGPTKTITTTTTANSHVPLSLRQCHGNSSSMPKNITSSLSSLLGIGQHLTLTPTIDSSISSVEEGIMELLLGPSMQHAGRNAPYDNANANVTLCATTIHTLSSYLQSILNIAISSAQCCIPAFGLWSPHYPNTSTNSNSTSLPWMHTIMNVPTWLNHAGYYFQLAADTSPCRIFTNETSNVEYYKINHSAWKGSKRERKLVLNYKQEQELYLPSLLTGYCCSSSTVGASFAIHVVPPGIAFPTHCTTLNSLGHLLLQNCPLSTYTTTPIPSPTTSYGTVAVSCARHFYHWSKLFEKDIIQSTSFEENDTWTQLQTHNLEWRKCLLNVPKKENDYINCCIQHILRLLYFAAHSNPFVEEEEPMWGPVDDPLDTIALSVTWMNPLLSLPLRIRSHHSLTSHDVLEMENTLLSNLFNPLYTEEQVDLSVKVDDQAACTSLSATNRSLLASLIRTATLDPDTLLQHLTKSSVLYQLQENNNELMIEYLSHLHPVTRKLVEVFDWASMADRMEEYHSQNNLNTSMDSTTTTEGEDDDEEQPERWTMKMIQPILNGYYRGESFGGRDGFPPEDGQAELSLLERFPKAAPPGRLCSLLCTSMASLHTPAAIATLWLDFVEELRLKWEQRTSLPNLSDIPGLDHAAASVSKSDGRSMAGLLHHSEADPDLLYHCLLHQKLQVFNIGIESIIAQEAEEYRQHLEQQSEIDKQLQQDEDLAEVDKIQNPISQQEDNIYNQSEAPTELMGNKNRQVKGKLSQPTIHEDENDESSSFESDCFVQLPIDDDHSLKGFDVEDHYDEDADNDGMEEANDMAVPTENVPQPILLNDDRSASPTYTSTDDDFFTSIETATFESCTVGHISPTASEDGQDDITNNSNINTVEEYTAHVMQRQARRGARCPVIGLVLTASGDQLYAPYLQRTIPLTDDLLLKRRLMVSSNNNHEKSTKNIASRINIAHRLQQPKLKSDMSSFKAANPGAVFQDFINWYGNPENPLNQYNHTTTVTATDFTSNAFMSSIDDASEAIQILMAVRTFWSDTWDDAEACPASEQTPLYDASTTIEMLLQSLESMHPAHLMNQVVAVNFAMAYFSLQNAAKPNVISIPLVQVALARLKETINIALEKLGSDMTEGTLPGTGSPNLYVSPDTIKACDTVCDVIGDVEIILSRATSLLTKLPGEYSLIQELLVSNGNNNIPSYQGRSGIFNTIRKQQQRNSGGRDDNDDNDLPFPSVREYILRNRDETSPCQLTVRIGGTHGLEEGGNNSTLGGLVLAMNKCVKD